MPTDMLRRLTNCRLLLCEICDRQNNIITRSQAVARIADRTAKIVGSRGLGHAQF